MGKFFDWETKYNLDIPHMDSGHQQIVDCMNLLHDLHEANAGHTKVDRAMLDLVRVTTRHFAEEEALMEKIGFEDRRKHGLIHKSLLQRLQTFHDEFERDRKLTEDFFVFLKMWLKSHICGIDVKYAAHAQVA